METANTANHGPWMRIGIAVLLAVLTACSNSSNNQPRAQKPQAVNPMVEGPITGGGGDDCCVVNVSGFPVDLRIDGLDYEPATPFYTFLNFDMAEVGYVERVLFFRIR